jgi:magnesium-transporting ATPase (P-type)
MMLLISLAITVAYLASMATSLDRLDLEFWWELAALVTIMLLGHWQEMKVIGQAQGALAALAELLPDEAEVIDGDAVRLVALSDLGVGDVVLVRAVAWSCVPPASEPTPSSPRSAGSSTTRRPARRPCNTSPIGSRRCSSRS